MHGNFSPTSSHFHPLQVKNCDSNSWLVVDEDDNGKISLERVELLIIIIHPLSYKFSPNRDPQLQVGGKWLGIPNYKQDAYILLINFPAAGISTNKFS